MESQKHIYIDTNAARSTLLEELQSTECVALDTEADSLHRYRPKVCLIQLAANGKSFIIDPLSGIDISSLLDALKNKPLILHGADYDLRMLNESFSFRPIGGIFDTMLAARIIGLKEIGLAALIKRYFNINISKQGQKSDWSRRPLTEAQIDYAVIDVIYLEALADHLKAELIRLGRESWHRESCGYLVQITGEEDEAEDEGEDWRIKGSGTLNRRELAFIKELWCWREHEAERADVPPFKIMGNRQIIELARWAQLHPGAYLDGGNRILKSLRGRRLALLGEALERARKMSNTDWPLRKKSEYKKRPKPHRMKELVEECARLAHELQIEPSVLATRASLEAIARYRPRKLEDIISQGKIMHWQAELIEPIVKRIFS